MKTIDVDDAIYLALEKRVQKFGETPNDVIRRLLNTPSGPPDSTPMPQPPPVKPLPSTGSEKQNSMMQLIASPHYQMGDAKERYFAVLSHLYQKNPDQFRQLEGFKRGSRVNISRDIKKIENSGTSTHPQKLGGTPYYVMTNLDNKRKREILEDVLRLLNFPRDVIDAVTDSIPDSGISRPKRNFYKEY